MVTYERYLPAYHARYYDWRRRDYAQYIAYDLGAKPIVVRPDDYDAQLRAERLPGTVQRGVAKESYAGKALIGDLIEPLLTGNECMAVFEISRAIGKRDDAVNKALNRDARFERKGRKWISGQQYTMWALKAGVIVRKSVGDEIAEVLAKAEKPMRLPEIAAAVGRTAGTVSSELSRNEQFSIAHVGGRPGKPGKLTFWILSEQQGSAGHD